MTSRSARRSLLGLAWLGVSLLGAGATAEAGTFPGRTWATATPESQNVDRAQLDAAIAVSRRRGGEGMVVRNGYAIASWGGSIYRKSELASGGKSWSSLITGLAIADGVIPGQQSKARAVYPGFVRIPNLNTTTERWLSEITVHQLLTMTAGFGSNTDGFAPLKFAPGRAWFYSNSAVDALGDVVTYAYGRDLLDVLRERILRPIGVADAELEWRVDGRRVPRIDGKPDRTFAGGIRTDLNAMARVGLLLLNRGAWKGRQLIPAAYVDQATRPQADVARAGNPGHECPDVNRTYGLLWFTNALGEMRGVPRDAYWQWGDSDRITMVVPSLDLVVARTGGEFRFRICYDGLESFFAPLVRAMR